MKPMRSTFLLLSLSLAGCAVDYTILSGSGTEGTAGTEGSGGSGGTTGTGGTACPTEQINCEECPADQEKCGDACVALGTCECIDQCPSDLESCVDNTCQCRDGLAPCADTCTDTRTDPHHCGACDHECSGATPVCQDSQCVAHCEAGWLACDGSCIHGPTDSLNCGVCDKLCKVDEVCVNSECQPYTALPGCVSCPCSEACDDITGGSATCCSSMFLDKPVCLAVDCP
jgi:hypothetical protein